VTIESPEGVWLAAGLAPMAVVPEFQRKGVGGRLVEEGLKACREAGYGIAVVLGHPTYYPRFGFKPAHTRGIFLEFDVPEDAFMVMELKPGAMDGCSGTARYLPEFSAA